MKNCKARIQATGFLVLWFLMPFAVWAGDVRPAWFEVIEAEGMHLRGDWRVIKGQEGYFPSAPNGWSADRIRGGLDAAVAVATQVVEIPADGRYAVWVRYESPYGFDVHFDITITQGAGLLSRRKTVYEERFGDRSDLKYFNGTWRVQRPWRYHNTDYVYQRGFAELEKGPAVITLSKNTEGKYTAARIVDLVYLERSVSLGRALNSVLLVTHLSTGRSRWLLLAEAIQLSPLCEICLILPLKST